MNIRLKLIRKTLGLNQNEVGQKVNLSRSHISSLENGTREVTERLIADYCREFNVNEDWLRTGKGEMFEESDATIIAELAAEYNLDDIDKLIIEHYLKLDDNGRESIKKYVLSVAKDLVDNNLAASDILDIDEEVERYRQELEASKKAQKSSVLGNSEGAG